MCGILGVLGGTNFRESDIRVMLMAIQNRGPDDYGIWINQESEIRFGHVRLSIVDLSEAGHQPMLSQNGRYEIVFNGEIYNHLELRRELNNAHSGIVWRGHSDTETLLAGFEVWGIENTIEKTIGMFALGVWDIENKILFLCRDRIGEKPLYYGWIGKSFIFSSDLNSIRKSPNFEVEIDRDSINMMMHHNYIPAPSSIYKGIFKLLPGSILSVSLKEKEPVVKKYWNSIDIINSSINNPFSGSPDEAVNLLEKLLLDAVSKQMMSDVPLGAFLSGGIDSTTIVALMQAQSDRKIKTFTIGFDEVEFDEAVYAKKISKHLGTEHVELYVSSKDALNIIPSLAHLYSEPFSDSSSVPTFLVSQLARKHVTVSLSGDAGDELFCGYSRYFTSQRLWKILSKVPISYRSHISRLFKSISITGWNRLFQTLQFFAPSHIKKINIADKIQKSSGIVGSKDMIDFYDLLLAHWNMGDNIVLGAGNGKSIFSNISDQINSDKFLNKLMAIDLLTYLPDDILVKVDRAAMGVSLETRVPFLDPRVVEFAWKIPLHYKTQNGISKWPLRQVLLKYVPEELVDRKKMGFAIPTAVWLRGPLKDWAEDLLDESKLKDDGYLNVQLIRERWKEHLSGKRNWQHQLWDVLMFQAWLRTYH